MNESLVSALDALHERGRDLRGRWRFDWPEAAQQAVLRMRLDVIADQLPAFVAILGGASSGKSTVFNNLLEGHLSSRITARGHTTLGPIVAVHEEHGPLVERLLDEGRLLPGFRPVSTELDGNVTGEPDTLATLFHTVDALRGVVLFDLPDFTSQRACEEGDVALSLLPWFDRIVVVIDHERWFDRQSISMLRAESSRFGQQRLAAFNRTKEDVLGEDARAAFARQGERLGAEGTTVLEFRRGRGFCVFPPGVLDDIFLFLGKPRTPRTGALLAQTSEAANRTLNQNEERDARLNELRGSVRATAARMTPSVQACMTSLMTPAEHRQVEPFARILRIQDTKAWLATQRHRLRAALEQVPIVSVMLGVAAETVESDHRDDTNRSTIAEAYCDSITRRQTHEIQRVTRSSAFWDEMRRWTDARPREHTFTWNAELKDRVHRAAGDFDKALALWLKKVESECRGISPHVVGALGVGGLGLALVLIAVPGPVAALTLVSAKGAIGATLAQLATATGTGALLGRPMGRLLQLARERLIGSDELAAVHQSAAAFRKLLESGGRRLAEDAIAEASGLVMDHSDPLVGALECLRTQREVST